MISPCGAAPTAGSVVDQLVIEQNALRTEQR